MLRGVDLSFCQTGVNYAALGGAVDFAYVKACDWNGSAWVQDAQLATHVAGLIEYAVPFGLYCFGHPSQSVIDCAQAFTRIAEGWGATLRPVIDMESLSQGHIPGNAGPWAREWVDRVPGAIVYASTSYYLAMLRQAPSLAGVPWWRAEYHDACPPSMPPGPAAVALQWSGTARVPGITGNADADVVYADDLSALLA
jgi:GH25 family lysozyme M1 (1,4-beta-N-acetylmuramidase)